LEGSSFALNPNPDKPEQKENALSRKHEGTRKHEKNPQKNFVSSYFRVFVISLLHYLATKHTSFIV